jgi:hypothetical protein
MVRRAVLLFVSFTLSAFVIGCGDGDKLSKENYDRVTTGASGMTVEQVEGLLGKGKVEQSAAVNTAEVNASMQTRVWEQGGRKVTVEFVNGKAAVKTQKGL